MTTHAARNVYDSTQWKTVCKRIRARDAYTCQVCGERGNTVDHCPPITELLRDGLSPYDPAYLRVLCARCSGMIDGGGHVIAPIIKQSKANYDWMNG